MKFIAGLILIIFCWLKTSSQSFEAEAAIPGIETDGFYRIFISPAINVYLNNDFSDIRIYDQQNREVPYLFQKGYTTNYPAQMYELEIVGNEHNPACCTLVMLHNSNLSPNNGITLVVKNPTVAKNAILMGSNDRQHWLTLKDWSNLQVSGIYEGTSEIRIADLPSSNYEFYFMRLNEALPTPLNIIRAGFYGKHTEILPRKIITTENASEKKTYVRLLFDTAQFVDKLEIKITGPKFYRRKATLSEKRIGKSKKRKQTVNYNPIQHFELTTKPITTVELPEIRTQELLLVIENEDNPPLTISTVKSFQVNRYLTAWLKKNDQYTIRFGQPDLKAPVYDLPFFKDSIPSQVKVLEAGEINKVKKIPPGRFETFFTTRTIIWIAIVVVILVLGFMSARLIRESGKAKD